MEPLEKELATYRSKLPELISNEGKFAVISGDQVLGIYETYADALKTGYEKVGTDVPFLVKQISQQEQAFFISRDVIGAVSCLA